MGLGFLLRKITRTVVICARIPYTAAHTTQLYPQSILSAPMCFKKTNRHNGEMACRRAQSINQRQAQNEHKQEATDVANRLTDDLILSYSKP